MDIALNLGADNAGLTDLRAQLRVNGASSRAPISAGFSTDLGGGTYEWIYDLDGFVGSIAFYSAASPANILMLASANASQVPTLTLTPIQASVANPRFATRDLAAILAGSAPTDCWTITDSSGNPIDLSAKTVRFVVASMTDATCDPFSADFTELYQYQTGGGGIVINGTGNNIVNVSHSAANTTTPGRYWYFLLNVTDLLPLSRGQLLVVPTPAGVWS